MKDITEVDMDDVGPVIVRVISSSSTVYYLDLRGGRAMMMRARGQGSTGRGFHDGEWVMLTGLTSGPTIWRDGEWLDEDDVDKEDLKTGVIRVGSRHTWDYHVPGGMMDVTDYYFTQRAVEHIELLDEMPDEAHLTAKERLGRAELGGSDDMYTPAEANIADRPMTNWHPAPESSANEVGEDQ